MDLDEDMPLGFSGKPLIKRKAAHDPDYENGEIDEDELMQDVDVDMDDEEDEEMVWFNHPSKRRLRNPKKNTAQAQGGEGLRRSGRHQSTQPSYAYGEEDLDDNDTKGKGRSNQRKKDTKPYFEDDDMDELAGDEDPFIVKSDVLPPKRKRGNPHWHRRKVLSDDEEAEAPRRSGRATKASKMMQEPGMDDEFYAPEEEKLPSAPKVSGAREAFNSTLDGPFKQCHSSICGTCGNNANYPNKGMMVYCQSCSIGYHKICLGFRSTRDHIATKIGPSQFVLQCRDCVAAKKQKDNRNPSLDICQVCQKRGNACTPFAPKRSAAAEAKLREENGGEDPITKVNPKLLNNPDNVLFRCMVCRCAYHFEHLPRREIENFGGSVRSARLSEYSVDWKCKDCADQQHKISSLVAWRPIDRASYKAEQTYYDLPDDAKEYLVKWETLSYAHCEWKRGSWVAGVTKGTMRNAFPKRNNGINLLPKFHEKDAIPDEYLLADIVLDVRYKGSFRFESKKEDLRKTHLIDKALIKFEGLDYADAVWDDIPSEDKSSPRWKAFKSAYEEYLNGKHFRSEPTSAIKERLRWFRNKDFATEVEFDLDAEEGSEHPMYLQGRLMKYQLQGLNWLLGNFHQQRSVVLADEMGLGKTIQVISLIASLALPEPRVWPFLVVVPNSTCPNWRREIKKWCPDLRVVAYHGGREPQKLAYKYELFPNGAREMKAHVVIMSYDSAQDPETRIHFKNIYWVGLVVDEGQRLKNDSNILYGALQSMKIPWRLLLTGTPLQNNKRELFNLLQFIDSSKNAIQLDEKYAEITADNIGELHAMIKPYFLRRTKAGVLHFLPPMAQIILPVSMSVVQEKLCKSIMAKNPELIRAIFANGKLKQTERSSLNNILMQLRKCLGHPFLYSGAVEDKSVDAETMHRNLVLASSKLVLLEQMLPKLQAGGHRVLIFSQFLGMLDIVEDFLNGMDFKYQRLDGSISSLEKQKRIDAYNEPDSKDFAFLLSTRAGGVGINLATADTVIILDPDFNPHQDLQALSRAHRIGQQKTVLCFQLMTKSSVEEKIMQIGRKKMALDHALIESMDREEDDAGEDLESILKHGAEALFSNNDKDKEVIKYDSEAIDKLLDRSQIRKADLPDDDESRPAEKQFAFAQVWENNKGQLTDDIQTEDTAQVDIGIWDKILKEREDEARRLAELNKEVLGRGNRRRQRVKYGPGGNAIDFEDPPELQGSDIDEDFITSESSSDETDRPNKEDTETDATANPNHSAPSDKGKRKHKQPPSKQVDQPVEPPSKRPRGRRPKQQQPEVAGRDAKAVGNGQSKPKPKPKAKPKVPPTGGPSLDGRQPTKFVIPVPSARFAQPAMHGHGGGVPSQQPMASGFPGFVGSQPPFQNAFPFHGLPNGGQPQLPPQLAQQQLGYHNFFQQPVQQLQLATTLNPFNGHLVASTGPPTPGYALVSNNTQVVPRQQPMQNQNMAHHMVPTPVPAPVHHHRHMAMEHRSPMLPPSHTADATGGAIPKCPNCPLYHLPTRKCPPLAKEIHIRLALDGIKALSGGDPATTKKNKDFLQALLKGGSPMNAGATEGNNSPKIPTQLSQFSPSIRSGPQLGQQNIQQQHQQHQQMLHQPTSSRPTPPAPASVQVFREPQTEQARLTMAAEEEEDDEEESSSESESESESGSGSESGSEEESSGSGEGDDNDDESSDEEE